MFGIWEGLGFEGRFEVDNVSIRDFVRFLATPDAEEILSAVFRNCDLRYWKKAPGRGKGRCLGLGWMSGV